MALPQGVGAQGSTGFAGMWESGGVCARTLHVVSVGRDGRDRVSRFGNGWLELFQQVWHVRAFLVVWPLAVGWVGQGYRGPGYESSIKEVVSSVGSRLDGFHMKGTFPGELLAISRNQLVLGGAGPPGSARPQDVKAPKHGVKRHD